jgi:hypothetical protein
MFPAHSYLVLKPKQLRSHQYSFHDTILDCILGGDRLSRCCLFFVFLWTIPFSSMEVLTSIFWILKTKQRDSWRDHNRKAFKSRLKLRVGHIVMYGKTPKNKTTYLKRLL